MFFKLFQATLACLFHWISKLLRWSIVKYWTKPQDVVHSHQPATIMTVCGSVGLITVLLSVNINVSVSQMPGWQTLSLSLHNLLRCYFTLLSETISLLNYLTFIIHRIHILIDGMYCVTLLSLKEYRYETWCFLLFDNCSFSLLEICN